MKRRVPSFFIGGIGVLLILIPLTANLFTVAPAVERLTDDFRPEMQAAELTQLNQDLDGLVATQAEFTTKAVPQLATAVDMSPTEFSALLGQQFPAVASGLQSVPAVSQHFDGVLTVLAEERARFDKADAIPMKSLPATTVPWGLAVAGLACIGVAFMVPRRPGAATAVALGLLLVVGPLVLSLPGKADAADTMNSNLKPVYNAELVTGARQSLAGIQAMGTELQTKMLPALAGMLRMSEPQVQAYLLANFPTVTAGMASMPAALGRFERMVNAFDRSLDNYDTAKGTELLPIVWMVLAAGVLVAGAGGYVLIRGGAGAPVAAARKPRGALRERLAGAHGHGHFSH
jgi:hypothetical protein